MAAGLSFLWCGFGQIYNGQVSKGVVFALLYLLAIIFFWVGRSMWLIGMFSGDFTNQPVLQISSALCEPALWIYGVVDAYRTATAINVARGLAVPNTTGRGFWKELFR